VYSGPRSGISYLHPRSPRYFATWPSEANLPGGAGTKLSADPEQQRDLGRGAAGCKWGGNRSNEQGPTTLSGGERSPAGFSAAFSLTLQLSFYLLDEPFRESTL